MGRPVPVAFVSASEARLQQVGKWFFRPSHLEYSRSILPKCLSKPIFPLVLCCRDPGDACLQVLRGTPEVLQRTQLWMRRLVRGGHAANLGAKEEPRLE